MAFDDPREAFRLTPEEYLQRRAERAAKAAETADPNRELRPFEEKFVHNVMLGHKPTIAAREAGYSKPNIVAAKVLDRPCVRNEIIERRRLRAEKLAIDELWVLLEAKDVYERARDAGKYGEAISALKLIGSHVDIQAFKERVVTEHTLSPDLLASLGRDLRDMRRAKGSPTIDVESDSDSVAA